MLDQLFRVDLTIPVLDVVWLHEFSVKGGLCVRPRIPRKDQGNLNTFNRSVSAVSRKVMPVLHHTVVDFMVAEVQLRSLKLDPPRTCLREAFSVESQSGSKHAANTS